MKRIASLFLVCVAMPLAAQKHNYAYSKTTTLAGSAEVVTVQLPAGTYPDKEVTFKGVAIYCTVECAFTLERDGTAASTTAATAQPLNRSTPSAYALVFNTSNAGAGTTLSAYTVPAGATMALDLSQKRLTNPGENLTIRTASITGTVKINFQWEER